MLKPIFEVIPQELKDVPHWVNWKIIERDGKLTKPPYQPDGQLAKTNDSSTWSTFSSVEGAAPQHNGIGFVLTKDDPYVGLDFDHCRCPAFDGLDDELGKEITCGLNVELPEVADYIRKLNSYTEISPSGRGIRVFLKGTLPVDGKRKGPVEVYQSGRYVTVTGHVLDGFPRTIEHRQEELDAFYHNVFGPTEETTEQVQQAQTDINTEGWKNLLNKAFQSQNGPAIKRLYDGDHSAYPSPSEADLALCAHLAFWLGKNPELMDQAFRSSGLMRQKWNEKHDSGGRTYGQLVIEKATLSCRDTYTGLVIPEDWPKQESAMERAITRLAALSPLKYDQVRKTEAKELGVRPTTLDAAVKNARRKSDTKDMHFAEVDPWPEAVDPASLLTDIASTIQRFIICSKEVSHAVALWIAMTWFIDAVQVVPIALITAPEPRCGKTHLLSLLGKLSARAITASNISPAALFRTIEAWQPTLLIDEADTFVKGNEDLRGLLDSGHTRDSAYVIRTVGENFTPTKFSTWGAKALAGIGHVANTIMDRSVILELRRKLSHEKVESIRHADPSLFDELRSKLARFAEDYQEKVRQVRPPLPPNLNDRAQDNWEPLLAIAMMAGDNWLKIGTTAAVKISGTENTSQTIGTELLYDIQEIFEEKQLTRISTAELITALCADDEKPWATYNRGLPIKPRQLAKKLNGYGIHSKTIRIGFSETPKGFERHQFEDAFARYVSSSPENIRHTPQNLPAADLVVADVADNPQRCGYEIEKETLKTKPVAECGVVEAKRFPQVEIFLTEDDIQGVPL